MTTDIAGADNVDDVGAFGAALTAIVQPFAMDSPPTMFTCHEHGP